MCQVVLDILCPEWFLFNFFSGPSLWMLLVSQKDSITKHACDKEFQALKACIRQAVSFLVD